MIPEPNPGEDVTAWAKRAARIIRQQTDPMTFRGIQEYPGDLRRQYQQFTDTTAAYERGEDVVPGDCWRACLASLLEVPLAEVPHFVYLYRPADQMETLGPRWWLESIAWVEQQRPDWTLRAYNPDPNVWDWAVHHAAHESGPDRLILTGKSPRGDWNHSALYDVRTMELAHDPFPGGGGVMDPLTDIVLLVREEWL